MILPESIIPADRYGVVYVATHRESGKQYVGQTTRTPSERWIEHGYHKTSVIAKAIAKYGSAAFDLDTLDWAMTKVELDHKECFWVAFLETMERDLGYNLKEGGAAGRLSPDVCKRISTTKRGRKLPPTHPFTRKGQTPWNKGKPADPDAIARMRATKLAQGLKANAGSFKQGLIPWNKGKRMSEAYRLKSGHGVRRVNRTSFKKGHPSGQTRGKIGLPAGPNGEIRYFRPEQLI